MAPFRKPLLLAIGAMIVTGLAFAQAPTGQPPSAEQADTAFGPVYKLPLRGVPEGRVGGASRGASTSATPLPRIELLAPANHSGFTANPQPTLYFFISRPSQWPVQFTIAAPLQPSPVLEVTIPRPQTGGIYALPLSNYGVRLQPEIVYTWSVSIILDGEAWSRNIIASAPIVFDPTPALTLPVTNDPTRRAAYFAEMGLWYDAIAAAAEAQSRGSNSAIAALLQQGGISGLDAMQ